MMKLKILSFMVVFALIFAVSGVVMGGETTTDENGVRHLYVSDGDDYGNLTLPEVVENNYSADYSANATTSLSLKVGNNSMSDTYNLNTSGGSVWLNYTDGDFWANFTINGGADYINVTFTSSTMQAAIEDTLDLIVSFIPLVIVIIMVVIIGSVFESIKMGGKL